MIKTSGSKGLQVYLPLNTPTTYKETRPFARAVAQLLEKEHGDLVVARMTKELRRGKVERHGDVFAAALELEQKLPTL